MYTCKPPEIRKVLLQNQGLTGFTPRNPWQGYSNNIFKPGFTPSWRVSVMLFYLPPCSKKNTLHKSGWLYFGNSDVNFLQCF